MRLSTLIADETCALFESCVNIFICRPGRVHKSNLFNALAAVRRARKEGVAIVNIATLNEPGTESVLRCIVSDEELEAAAEEIALSYTFQTSQYNLCCQ
jgi:hypothetical protein